MNIFLPDSLKTFIETQVTERGYRSSSEFVRDLVRHEQSREQLRALVVDRARRERESELDDLHFDRLRAPSGRIDGDPRR